MAAVCLDFMYGDFFPPPAKEWTRDKPTTIGKPGKGGEKKNGKQVDSKLKAKGKGKAIAAGDEMDIDDDEKDARPTATGSSDRDIMARVQNDLFEDDDAAEEAATTANLSTHEKRMLALREQISALEQENVGPKDWTLLGEAKSRDRPQNSLLEEDLEFEQSGKVVPIVTEERVLGLEEMIKKRILDVSVVKSEGMKCS